MDAVTFKKSLSEYQTLYPEICLHLSADRKVRLDVLVIGVRNAWQKGDRGVMAIQSIEAYRLLQESIDHSGQPVPVEVPMFDYAGFKLNGLLLSTQPDWKQVANTRKRRRRGGLSSDLRSPTRPCEMPWITPSAASRMPLSEKIPHFCGSQRQWTSSWSTV